MLFDTRQQIVGQHYNTDQSRQSGWHKSRATSEIPVGSRSIVISPRPKRLTLIRPLLFTILIQRRLILLITLSRRIDFQPSLPQGHINYCSPRSCFLPHACRTHYEEVSQTNIFLLFLNAWAWNGSPFAGEASMPHSCMSILQMSSERKKRVRIKAIICNRNHNHLYECKLTS
mgnify:CR=1 FL=1